MKIKSILALFVFCVLFISGFLCYEFFPEKLTHRSGVFNGERALQDIEVQVGFGPRTPGSVAHAQTIIYIQNELDKAGWESEVLLQEFAGHTASNILATRSLSDTQLLLGAHYDSRIYADADPIATNHLLAVPGANDGASGVAVLLEIARTLSKNSIPTSLLFIDLEDNGRIPGWDWILGSRAFVQVLAKPPKAVIIIDMIGDSDLNIFMEKNSDTEITAQLWSTAKKLGYESTFIPEYKYQILDDHIPFLEEGIRAVDIIDFDYPYWHTTEDTLDKISANSLTIVGNTILTWILDYGACLDMSSCLTE